MSTFEINLRNPERHEATASDDDAERRAFSLRALLPGPYVRDPRR